MFDHKHTVDSKQQRFMSSYDCLEHMEEAMVRKYAGWDYEEKIISVLMQVKTKKKQPDIEIFSSRTHNQKQKEKTRNTMPNHCALPY